MIAPGEIRPLTGLRALAMGWVVAFHMGEWIDEAFPALGVLKPVLGRGYLGVDLFFVLSGFVLTHNYGGAFAKIRPRACGVFYLKRLARIYPVHLAGLALVGLLTVTGAFGTAPYSPVDAKDLALNLALIHAWGLSERSWNVVSWAISALWLAYLVFPFLDRALACVRSTPLLAAVFGAAVVGLLAGYPASTLGASTYHGDIGRVLMEMIAGMTLYRLADRSSTAFGSTRIAVECAVGMAGVFAFGIRDSLAVPFLAGFIAFAATSRGSVTRLVASRAAVWAGTISYAVYMVHHPLIAFGRAHMPGRAGFLATVVLIVGVGWAVYRFVERPARAALLARIGAVAATPGTAPAGRSPSGG